MAPLPPSAYKLLSPHGAFNVQRAGGGTALPLRYIYFLLRAPWRVFIPLVVAHYLLANLAFATLYSLQPGAIHNAHSFVDLFFFSVQTVLTIGYGGMLPATTYANVLVTCEAFGGLVATSLITGLFFVRVLKPGPSITFSRRAVIFARDGVRRLCFRVADTGHRNIARAELSLVMIRSERTASGRTRHHLVDLPLEQDHHPALALTWLATHVIDGESALSGASAESLRAERCEILVTFEGIDVESGQTVVARHSYVATEISWDSELANIVEDRDGVPWVDYRRFHDTEGRA